MPLFINTNVASLNAQRHLNKTTTSLGKTFSRLSSGLRINTASDDAAGMAISNRMTAQIRGLNQAVRNANDAISLSQVAEGALDETTNALQRIRELSVQSANDTNVSSDRKDMQKEVDQLLAEIQRIADDTEFNTQNLLGGSFSGRIFQVGAFSGQTISLTIDAATASALGVLGVSINSQSAAASTITTIDRALDSISDIRANLGAIQNRFESVIANLSNVSENMSAARSRIQDADIADETAQMTRASILQQAGTAVLAQANQQPQLALQLLG